MGNKPRIRFKGFTEDWEQRKLSDVADVRDGTHDSPKFYNDGFPLVTSKNLKGGSIDFSDCSFISEQDFNEINKRSKVDPGDILFGMIGTIGNPAIVEHTGFAIKNVALIKEGNIINNRFIYHLLSSKVFENYIARENAGGTQKFIALNQIRNFDFLAPALVEQNKIIELLDCISQNITLHQCKLEKLKLTKKALLQKLFPKNGKHIPEIRFKGFTDAWEQRKLKSIANTIVAGGDIDKTKIKEIGTYPVIANALTKEGIVGYYNDDYRIEAPAVTVTGRGDIGVAKARHQNFTPVVRLLSLTTAHDVDFIEHAINNLKIVSESTGVPQLTVPQLSNYKIHITSIIEEQKIGVFISKLDNLITLHQRKLERLQEVKKGLLQKMFV